MSRGVEVVLASTVLVLLAPLLVLIVVANKICTGGVLFRQTRLGETMRPFTILKFQTMVSGSSGSTITVSNDQRITRFGKLLRMLKLDELPQLVNVLRGEMGLVGPRALPPNEVERVPREVSSVVYSVRPGMTGLASLVFIDEEHLLSQAENPTDHYYEFVLPRKMALESQYVARKSAGLDLLILACTVLAIVSPSLARSVLGKMGGFQTQPGASGYAP